MLTIRAAKEIMNVSQKSLLTCLPVWVDSSFAVIAISFAASTAFRMAEQIENMQNSGFKVYVILFSTIEQWKGPEDFEPTHIGVKFHPKDKLKMNDRLQENRRWN